MQVGTTWAHMDTINKEETADGGNKVEMMEDGANKVEAMKAGVNNKEEEAITEDGETQETMAGDYSMINQNLTTF